MTETIPEIYTQSLVPGNENFVSKKLTKFNQVYSSTDAVVRTGLNRTEWRHCCKVLVGVFNSKLSEWKFSVSLRSLRLFIFSISSYTAKQVH